MTEMEVIQEIHGLFEFRPNGDELLKNKPEKMSSELFLSLAEKYRFYYPANNFVTERQVAEICKTYNLVCGPELLFSESIPKRAAHEISNFKLRPEDSTIQNLKHLFKLLLAGNIARDIYFPQDGGGIVRLQAQYRHGGPISTAIPVGNFVLIYTEKAGTPRFEIFLKVENYDSQLLVYITTVHPATGSVTIEREVEAFYSRKTFPAFAVPTLRVTVTFPAETLESAITIDLANTVCCNVVAPMEAFKNHADAVEVLDGYRLSFKSPEVLPSDLIFGVRDPIVLQPVQGGYLVVTKWGPEALMPEIQNGLQN